MQSRINKITNEPLAPNQIVIWVMAIFFFKFLFFDLIWAIDTTFSGFQFIQGWLTKIAFSALLTLPLLWIKRKWYVTATGFIIDIWLIANLMYFRTYYTVIPMSSYGLVGNLSDFQDSVWESLRWTDIVFPLSTILVTARLWTTPVFKVLKNKAKTLAAKIALWFVALPLLIVAVWVVCLGGYKKAYEKLMYDYSTCGAAVYTIPGTWLYEAIAEETVLTPEIEAEINDWIANKPDLGELPYEITAPDNVIILLCESLESWVLNTTIEGQEITPNLNRFLAEDSVLYAPHVLNQVGGARSIDAQLILHTGLLPISHGAYSSRYPHHHYGTIDKAFKEAHPGDSRTLSFTVDKKTVWNVAIVAYDFGYDKLVDKPNFKLDVKTGPRNRLGDDSFLRQSYEKITNPDEDLWIPGGHNLLQLVTYSGHRPFIIPEELKTIKFSNQVPSLLRDYMQVANYTDRAIGDFIDKVRSNPQFANTMIVITGDHECISTDRKELIRNPLVRTYLSPDQMVPLIVLNSPVSAKYDGVMGQMDIYPTLLDLAGLNQYGWKGLGGSILRPNKKPYAISWNKEVIGDASDATPEEIEHAKRAYTIADLIISTDYFKDKF